MHSVLIQPRMLLTMTTVIVIVVVGIMVIVIVGVLQTRTALRVLLLQRRNLPHPLKSSMAK